MSPSSPHPELITHPKRRRRLTRRAEEEEEDKGGRDDFPGRSGVSSSPLSFPRMPGEEGSRHGADLLYYRVL